MGSIKKWESKEGSSYPLGIHYVKEENAFNFAIYSKHATRVTLYFYGEKDYVIPILSFNLNYLTQKSNRIWHIRINASELQHALYYAYKIDGPEPESYLAWHVFDKDKVL